jgi:hypothetical protein
LIISVNAHAYAPLLSRSLKFFNESIRFIDDFFANKNMLHELQVGQSLWPRLINVKLEVLYVYQLQIRGKTSLDRDDPEELSGLDF